MWPSSASEYERLNQAELDQENSQAPRYLRRRSRSTIVLLITNLLSLVALAAVAIRRDHSELESSNSRKCMRHNSQNIRETLTDDNGSTGMGGSEV